MNSVKMLIGLLFVACFILQPLVAQDDVQSLKDEIKTLKERVNTLENNQGVKAPEAKKDEKKDDKPYFNVFWKDGVMFETSDKAFTFTIGGRLFADFGFAHEDTAIQASPAFGRMQNYAEVRQAWINMSVTMYEQFFFTSEVEFAGTGTDKATGATEGQEIKFKNFYLGIKKLPLNGTFAVGHFKEPFGLEQLTSDRFTTFMERTSITTFTPGYNLGASYSFYTDCKHFTGSFGIFRETPDNPPKLQDDSGYAFTTRFTAIPYYENDGEQLFHLGVDYSYRTPVNHVPTVYSSRPESNPYPAFVTTAGALPGDAEDTHLLGVEAALVFGPFSLQSELIYSWIRSTGGNNNYSTEHYWGYYVSGSFFLTGEHRPYNQTSGTFGRVKPIDNFLSKDGGMGAFELAVRYSKIDLDDDHTDGGRMDDVTFGLNWYWNPNMRMMINYVYSRISGRRGLFPTQDLVDAHIFMTRFQVDF